MVPLRGLLYVFFAGTKTRNSFEFLVLSFELRNRQKADDCFYILWPDNFNFLHPFLIFMLIEGAYNRLLGAWFF